MVHGWNVGIGNRYPIFSTWGYLRSIAICLITSLNNIYSFLGCHSVTCGYVNSITSFLVLGTTASSLWWCGDVLLCGVWSAAALVCCCIQHTAAAQVWLATQCRFYTRRETSLCTAALLLYCCVAWPRCCAAVLLCLLLLLSRCCALLLCRPSAATRSLVGVHVRRKSRAS